MKMEGEEMKNFSTEDVAPEARGTHPNGRGGGSSHTNRKKKLWVDMKHNVTYPSAEIG
jgi:hypothetical protein